MTSNFIVDMKPQTLQKLIKWYILAFCLAMPAIGLAYYLNAEALYFTSTVVTSFGFLGYLFFVIAYLKKEIFFKNKSGYVALLALLALSALSVLFSVDRYTAIYGTAGRYEGLLAILAYSGIFIAGSVIYNQRHHIRILDMLIFVGIIQSVLGILQRMPSLEDKIPSYYNRFRIVEAAFVANGLTGSPFFLAAMLSIFLGIALAGALYDALRVRRWTYGAAALLFTSAGLFTEVIPALIGIFVAIITIGIFEIVRTIKNKGGEPLPLADNPLVRYFMELLCIVVVIVVVFLTGGIQHHDKQIMYQDSFYHLWITGPEGIKDNTPIYEHTWKEGAKLVKERPVFGAGPDCVLLGLYNTTETPRLAAGTIDRPYNEYLYIAMTRGIMTLLAYLALLALTIKRCVKNLKTFTLNGKDWTNVALLAGIAAYTAQAFFNMSAITAAPFFWLLLGLVWADRREN